MHRLITSNESRMNASLPPSSADQSFAFNSSLVGPIVNVSVLHGGNHVGNSSKTGVKDESLDMFGWLDTFIGSTESRVIALGCTVCAVLVSLYNIHGHLRWYTEPHLQRCILRILLLVPCYAVFSFLVIIFIEESVWFDAMRDMWDAVVVYSFLGLMMEYCGGENACLSVIMNSPGSINHVFPLNWCLPPLPLDAFFLRVCKQLAIQFVVVKPLMAVSNLIAMLGGYEENPLYRQIRSVVYNTSYTLALYVLVLFYKATHAHPGLAKRKPISKFLAVKMVVFATYYQSLLFTW